MHIEKLKFEETNQFAPLFIDYINGKKEIKEFYGNDPNLSSFEKQIKLKKVDAEKRVLLVDVLKSQYEGHDLSEEVSQNINKIKNDNTYTLTTGHQLNLFTGPLYFHFKIIATINACEMLSEKYEDYNFVPVFWMASEDHDFKEINHFNLNGNTHTWESDQSGAVGRFDTSQMNDFLNSIPIDELKIATGYRSYATLAGATRCLVNYLYGSKGLVILDGDDIKLKQSFENIIRDELINQPIHELVTKSSGELKDLGYKAQVNPRDINLFYLSNQGRERFVQQKGKFKVNNTELGFSESEILEELDSHPERFSPNALLRPVYQEFVLPNLAMIGGPAEVAYWLQLKSVFTQFDTVFPILMPRNFGIILSKPIYRKYLKMNLKPVDLFEKIETLKSNLVKGVSKANLNLTEQKSAIETTFKGIETQAIQIDKSLVMMVNTELKKTLNTIEKIEGKLFKAEKRNHENSINQVEAVKNFCFPNGKLQERYSNYLTFYFDKKDILDQIMQLTDPFDLRFNILMDDE